MKSNLSKKQKSCTKSPAFDSLTQEREKTPSSHLESKQESNDKKKMPQKNVDSEKFRCYNFVNSYTKRRSKRTTTKSRIKKEKKYNTRKKSSSSNKVEIERHKKKRNGQLCCLLLIIAANAPRHKTHRVFCNWQIMNTRRFGIYCRWFVRKGTAT